MLSVHKITTEVVVVGSVDQSHRILSFLVLDLLQSGVDPRTADKYGRTALHVASTKVDAAISRFSNFIH